MTKRLPVEPAPGPLEDYAARFDDLFANRAQSKGFRHYVEGLLLPEERNKTLTALANTEPVAGAQRKEAQSLQWFLTESGWDPEEVNRRRVELMREDPETAPNQSGALVIDETGDRKDGKATAHVGQQYLGGIGKIENGVVSVSSVYADERLYYPLEVEPYTPGHHFEGGKADPEFRTKPRIALELVERIVEMEMPFRAVVADILYGTHIEFRRALENRGIPFVVAVKPSYSWYLATGGGRETVRQVVEEHPWDGENDPGEWVALEHSFRDGHTERWWALEPTRWPFDPPSDRRLVVATTDPAKLPELTTFYLYTNLPSPQIGRSGVGNDDLGSADVAEITRLYALRGWIEQSYKQVKNSLGWAQYQVRKDLSIRRHWQLVCCAFSFCWWACRGCAEVGSPPVVVLKGDMPHSSTADEAGGGKKEDQYEAAAVLAAGTKESTFVASTVRNAPAILAGVYRSAPARGVPSVAR